MSDLRYTAIAALLKLLRLTGATRALAPAFRGRGVILTMHHVRPASDFSFAPNRILEITPEFLEETVQLLADQGYEIAALDEVPARLRSDGPPFAVLTFDDGYRDNGHFAWPVLHRHKAPFTIFVTPGFADATAPLWWLDLEEAIACQDHVSAPLSTGRLELPAATAEEKTRAFETIYWALRPGPEGEMRAVIARMAEEAGIDPLQRTRDLCMRWNEIRTMASDPLCTIGAHTMTHPMLAKHAEAIARVEMAESKAIIEEQLGREVRHLAFPVGDPGSAGAREFALARACGFETAVTTRPGVLFADHLAHLTALPRISVNGLFQRRGDVAALISGVPTALQNRGRRLNIA
ncbi:MAG: polysaccharide deacetylase family protein [Proteobacteria bacterium]|nr:polysaccharide deacetylase family protein [Pseudomonadota bacterium]